MRVERGRDFANYPPLSPYAGGEYDDYHYGNPGHGYIKRCSAGRSEEEEDFAEVEWDNGKDPPSSYRKLYFIGQGHRGFNLSKRYDLHIVSDSGNKCYTV